MITISHDYLRKIVKILEEKDYQQSRMYLYEHAGYKRGLYNLRDILLEEGVPDGTDNESS